MEILNRLKALKKERNEGEPPFTSHLEYMKWVDDVSPLLSFDSKLKSKFDRRASIADSAYKLNSKKGSDGNKNETIGILNQAITMLEIQPIDNSTAQPSSNKPEEPIETEKVSLHKIAERVIGSLLVLACVWGIAHYFGLHL